ncbi:MAG: 1,4-alpha-glucan branching protein GlgB [Acidobacteriota bacterium]
MVPKKINSSGNIIHGPTLITEEDIYLFKEGNHCQLYLKMGAHLMTVDGRKGTYFSVWAPNARKVSVVGNFNNWNPGSHPLAVRWDGSGIWEGFIPGLGQGELYKFHMLSHDGDYQADKGDPYAFFWEISPRTASVIWDLDYQWKDMDWMKEQRRQHNALQNPISAYEVHLGSWRRGGKDSNKLLSYREIASQLIEYVREMKFTHVELLPIMEHPFYGSWGYQTTGYFAPTSRYGNPQDFMYLIDLLHQNGIGVILDWVPSHFPTDEYGLGRFDGTHLYEHQDPRKGFHPDWKSYIFNYGRNEVRSFLISSAFFWLEKYHIDGLRVDAVASMLYLDYSRQEGEWIPNEYGGRENLQAISFIKRLNEMMYKEYPDIQTIAEESTAWPMVTRPVYLGGLGFGMKWNMGWMHDILDYMKKEPVHRKYHHNQLTFSIWYAFTENFILPLSHDEVVHGKGSLLAKMPGDDWQKFANLKLLLGFMFTHPGKKLLFMGGEFGQWKEWSHEESLEWPLLQYEPHQGIKRWVKDLNILYRGKKALHELDFERKGFEWVDISDWENSIIIFLRKGTSSEKLVLVACNFTPMPRFNYRVGVPVKGFWQEILNSDAREYGGSGQGNMGGVKADFISTHGKPFSLSLTLPPLSIVIFEKNKK